MTLDQEILSALVVVLTLNTIISRIEYYLHEEKIEELQKQVKELKEYLKT
jgi:hypothetical protein